jgi:phosphoglycolate phosphatase
VSDLWPRAIAFDLDGTLVDTAAKATDVLNFMLQNRGQPETDKSRVSKLVSLGVETMVAKSLGSFAQALADDLAEFRRLYRLSPPSARDLYPHTRDMLEALTGRSTKIGVCTNKREDLARDVIKEVGLEPFVNALVGAREGLATKPDPAPVLEVMRQLGVSAAEAIYVGDSEVDAEAARAAGLPFCLVTFGYPTGNLDAIDCDMRIDDFRDLLDRLDGSFAAPPSQGSRFERSQNGEISVPAGALAQGLERQPPVRPPDQLASKRPNRSQRSTRLDLG